LIQKSLVVGIIFLFIVSSVGSIGIRIGYDKELKDLEIKVSEDNPIDHIWPQQGYNQQHIGRSPYSTENNPCVEKWRFPAGDWCEGSPVIAENGSIYFGSSDGYLYAIYPNGTLKWKFKAERGLGEFGCSPAIADDETIYFGTTYGSYIQAVNPNGTSKWKHWVPDIDTSITIGEDGIIYYGYNEGIEARYPNGTVQWEFTTGTFVQSTPVVDDEGIIYFGSHDNYIYAVYPNGTLKWRFQTGDWVHGSPTIGADGTIYCASDDDYLYALYPDNGTQKWKTFIESGMRSSPSVDKNGNLYFGVWANSIYSVYPNGTIRWIFSLRDGDSVWGSTAAISDDGTIYIGNGIDYWMNGEGEIIALNLDGSLKWRKVISDSSTESSPVIGANGDVYICSSSSGSNDVWGHLHAFGSVETNAPPNAPNISGPHEGEIDTYYSFLFSSVDPDYNPVSFFVDWGDGSNSGWTRDYASGEFMRNGNTWHDEGIFTIKAKARDTFGLESNWSYFDVTMPMNRQIIQEQPLLNWFLDRFPLLHKMFVSFLGGD